MESYIQNDKAKGGTMTIEHVASIPEIAELTFSPEEVPDHIERQIIEQIGDKIKDGAAA